MLEDWGSERARFHLVGAYRGLAAVARFRGDHAEADRCLAESKRNAELSGNVEGLRLAGLYEGKPEGEPVPDAVLQAAEESAPAHHLIARVMALGRAAHALLAAGRREDGELLLRRVYKDAMALGLGHAVGELRRMGKEFEIDLDGK